MSDSFRSRAEAGYEPASQQVEKNLLIQQALNRILRISLEPIPLDEQMCRVLGLLVALPWLALEARGCIFLADDDSKELVMKAHIGMPAGTLSTCNRVPFGVCLCGRAFFSNEIVFAGCLDERHTIRYPGIVPHGHYCVPIVASQRRIGLLNLYVREGHRRSPAEEQFLRAVADILGGIIERQRMERAVRERERRLTAEHAVSQILAVSSSLHDASSAVLRAICESLDWDVGIVWAVDRGANLLRCVDVWHNPESGATVFEQDNRQRTYPPGIGLPGRVWAENTPIWVPDLAAEINLPRAPVAAKEGLHGTVGFPILNGIEFLGVLEFCSRGIRQPSNELIQMMASIGRQIGQFIERRQAEEALRQQEADRRIAQQIQQGLLPKAMPIFTGFQIRGRSSPAQNVGGDCFDFFPLGLGSEKNLGIIVADASGHGIGSALLVAETRAYLRALTLTCADVGTLLTLSNQRLAGDLVTDHFVTLILVRLDPRNHSLLYASAGHWPGCVLDRHGRIKAVLASTGLPLGIDSANEYPTQPPTTMEPDELVLLITDGIVEAASPDGKMFGLARTLSIVQEHRREPPDAILDALFQAVDDFSEHHSLDDITAVIIKAEAVA